MIVSLTLPDGAPGQCRWLHHHRRMIRRPDINGCIVTAGW
jgi:hypothetical protein